MLEQMSIATGVSERAGGVAEVAARHAAAGESSRRLYPEVVAALRTAGFARHFVPVEHGGYGGTFRELTGAVAEIGAACAATAWCASLAANLGRMAAFLPADGRAEVWADGPDAVVVGSLMPVGRAEPVDGGWRLTGRWPYISAVDFSDWALVCGQVPPGGPTAAKIFAIPRSEYGIAETWTAVGMRATGSDTLVADGVLVPPARVFDRVSLLRGGPVDSTAACHTVPLEAANGLSFAAPILGAAAGALAAWSTYVTEKTAGARPGAPGPSKTSYALTLARGSAEIDAARLLLDRVAGVADLGSAGTPLTTSQNLRDCSFAVDLLVAAVNRLFAAAGTSGQSESNVIQRCWRDVNCAATHVVLQFEPAANAYADHRLWRDKDGPQA